MSGRDPADREGMASWHDDHVVETHVFRTRIRVPLRLRFREWRRRRRMSARAREIEDTIGRRVTSAFLFGSSSAEAEYDRADKLLDMALEYKHDERYDRDEDEEQGDATMPYDQSDDG